MNKIPNWDEKMLLLEGCIIEVFVNDEGLVDARESNSEANDKDFTYEHMSCEECGRTHHDVKFRAQQRTFLCRQCYIDEMYDYE